MPATQCWCSRLHPPHRPSGDPYARHQSPEVPAARRSVGRVHRHVEQHRAGRRDPGASPARRHQGRRAHRRPDAGEPFLRPLLRHAARRPRLRRPAPGDAAERQVGLAPVGRHRRTCCRSARTPTTSACSSSRTSTHGWTDGARRRSTTASTTSGSPPRRPTTMAYLTREDIPFHYALADTFTICDAYHCSFIGSTDPNRYYMWTGYTGNDGTGGGPVLGNDEAGYGWTTYPERLEQAGVSWKIYQDIGDGLDAAGSWGWIDDAYRGNYGDNSLLYFNQYRNAQPGDPLYDKARTGTERRRPARASSTGSRADVQGRQAAAGLLDRRARGVHRAPELARQLRRLVHLPGPGRAHLRTPRCGARPRCSSRTTRTTASSTTSCRRTRRPPRRRAVDRRHRAATSTRATPSYAAGPYGLASGCRCSSSRRGAPAATSAPRSSTTPRSSGSWSAASACTSRTSRRGGGRSAATSPPPSTSPARTPSRPQLPGHRRLRAAGQQPAPRLRADAARRTPRCPGRSAARGPTRPLPYAPLVDGSADTVDRQVHADLRLRRRGRRAASWSPPANRTDGPWTYTTEAGKTHLRTPGTPAYSQRRRTT